MTYVNLGFQNDVHQFQIYVRQFQIDVGQFRIDINSKTMYNIYTPNQMQPANRSIIHRAAVYATIATP